ncbi:ATP-dependent nuclease [Alicyclobacillus ferrooxydans]|uniref:Endonuclease GajA/Old nuclease/RecF-like AAA domain-containing protein n=1 Tax=Alicyclobacillus ferrooxydans TaxID=471514 RepID=A0A0P9D2T4_9BACL|nr:AAA family ATPase [Alicyclobacillus ferrooxydans]KPV43824.1 hypothetical protein AN477_10650 [Alicyclobacillus ferrooxydans]
MQVSKLQIQNFRGILNGTVLFDDHNVIIGTNNSGKSTILDALSMVLGRDRMVRQLTEHDFFGSSPAPADRIRIIATVTGFDRNDPNYHSEWFRMGRAVPKWFNSDTGEVLAEADDNLLLCAQLGFAARFDHDSLSVEFIRYFHDDDEMTDPFDEDAVTRVSARLLSDFGLFIVPVSRTWDRVISFGSELFRRLVASSGGIPANAIMAERDILRNPSTPLDAEGTFSEVFSHIRAEFARLLPRSPDLKLRLTGTDSESLLSAIVPHYETHSGAVLPAARQGTGLLSLQIFMLLLEFGRMRANSGQNFTLAIEQPELHLSPGVQRRLVYRAQAVTQQSIITSHSPHVAASYQPTKIRFVENVDGQLHARPLLEKPLDQTAKNSIRKLLRDNREDFVAALMNEFVLIPEGRTDFEWFKLLAFFAEIQEGWAMGSEQDGDFGCLVGVVPTHDAAVSDTYQVISNVRSDVVVLVDGDEAGDTYVDELVGLQNPPKLVLQWAYKWTIEDVIGDIIATSSEATTSAANFLDCDAELDSILQRLKTKRPGIKGDYERCESLASLVLSYVECIDRTNYLFSNLIRVIRNPQDDTGQFISDGRSTDDCVVKVWQL